MVLGVVGVLLVWTLGRGPEETQRRTSPGIATERAETRSAAPKATDESGDVPVATRHWKITYLGPGGAPIPGVPVTVVDRGSIGETDETGSVGLDTPEETTSLKVLDPYKRSGWEVTEAVTVVRMERLLPLRVEFRRTDSGASVAVEDVRLLTRSGSLAFDGNRLLLSVFQPAGWNLAHIGFRAPKGLTTLHGTEYKLSLRPARLTDRLVVTVPLWPELDLTVRILDGDGKPSKDARVRDVWLDERHSDWQQRVRFHAERLDDNARWRVRGVPHLPGYPLTIVVADDPLEGFDGITIKERKVEVAVRCNVDPAWMPEPPPGMLGIGGGGGGVTKDTGSVEIVALRRDGSVASGAYIRSPRLRNLIVLDQSGRKTISGLPAGAYTIWLVDAGSVPTRAAVVISKGETTRVTIREDKGRTLRVRTIDKQGRPLAYRPLRLEHVESHASYHLVVGGVEQASLMTGADGSLTLPGVGREAVIVEAWIAGRKVASETVASGDGPFPEVTLTIP